VSDQEIRLDGTRRGIAQQFAPLSEAEQDFIDRLCAGEPADFDIVRASVVRGEVVSATLSDPIVQQRNRPTALIRGVTIVGPVFMPNLTWNGRVLFQDCRFVGPVTISGSEIDDLEIVGCTFYSTFEAAGVICSQSLIVYRSTFDVGMALQQAKCGTVLVEESTFDARADLSAAIRADGVTTENGLFIRKSILRGSLVLRSARSGKQIELNDLSINVGPGVQAIAGSGVEVAGSLLLHRTRTIGGAVHLVGASIGESLDFIGLRAFFGGQYALVLDRAVVRGAIFLSRDLEVVGAISARGIRAARVELVRAQIVGFGLALVLDHAVVDENIDLSDAVVHGLIQARASRIGGNFVADRAIVSTAGSSLSIALDGARIEGGVHMRNAHFHGQLVLRSVIAGGNLDITDLTVEAGSGVAIAIDASSVSVRLSLLANRLRSSGLVKLNNAHVTGNIELDHGTLSSKQHTGPLTGGFSDVVDYGAALAADNARVDGAVFLRETIVHGTIRLNLMQIARDLDLAGAQLSGGPSFTALSLVSTRIGERLRLAPFRLPPVGHLDLTGCSAGSLEDCSEAWSASRGYSLHGFQYTFSERAPLGLSGRLRWVLMGTADRPAEYLRLARAYEEFGNQRFGVESRVAAERAAHAQRAKSAFDVGWSRLLDVSVRYGWALSRLMVPAGAVVFLGTAFGEFSEVQPVSDSTAPFNPFFYSIDVFLPLIDLDLEDSYRPVRASVQFFFWVEKLSGWFLTTLLATSWTGVFKQTESSASI